MRLCKRYPPYLVAVLILSLAFPIAQFIIPTHPRVAEAAVHTYTAAPNAAIPDSSYFSCNGLSGPVLTSTINVPDSYGVADVDVLLNITHQWVADLVITLTHGATTITLVDRPGVPLINNCGSGTDNIITWLDDESGNGSVENADPPTGASYTPQQALSAFDGQNVGGDWTLSVMDMAANYTGTLVSWGLDIDDGIALNASATCNLDNLVVTITTGDTPFNITGTGPGLPLNNVVAGSYTLTGPGTWTGVTVTEVSGNLQSNNLGTFNCATNALAVTAACQADNLVVSITAGDTPFNITGTGPGLPLNNIAASTFTLAGPAAWSGLTVTELGGNLQTFVAGNFACQGSGIPVPNLGLIKIDTGQAQFALQSPNGQPLALTDGTPILLPADADHNGFDTYTVTGVVLADGDYWLSIFLGNTTWGWVPLDLVTPLTYLTLP